VAERYDSRKTLKPLSIGDNVRMQPIDLTKEWRPAMVTKDLGRRTYEVMTPEGKSFKRNRQFLRKRPASDVGLQANTHQSQDKHNSPTREHGQHRPIHTPRVSPSVSPQNITKAHTQAPKDMSTVTTATSTPVRAQPLPENDRQETRCGRVVKPPKRLDL